jgi:SHS2 domain-containing protein
MAKANFATKFKFLEEIATADVAFEAYGSSESELFENAALAVEETMVDTAQIGQKVKKKIAVESEELDKLLFDFLSELVYFKDADFLLFSKFSVTIKKNKSSPQKSRASASMQSAITFVMILKRLRGTCSRSSIRQKAGNAGL